MVKRSLNSAILKQYNINSATVNSVASNSEASNSATLKQFNIDSAT